MKRSEFRERLKQYKLAREENPGLKYWEWKAQPAEKEIPKYAEGTNGVEAGLEEDTVMLPIESPMLPQSHDPYYTQWQSDWLNHRRKQLFNNIKASHIPTTWYSKKPDLDDIDIRDQKYDRHKHGGDLFKYLYWALRGHSTNRIAVNQEFYRQLNNAATAPETTLDDYDWNTAGVYVKPNILNGTGHYIAYVKNTELTHKIHERTHASHADPQEDAILKIIGGNNNRETPYLKRPTEVYSRLMQYRHDLKLDPKQVITDEYLNEHRDLLEEYDLNIFTDEQLLDIFNDVADNATTSTDDRLFLKNGGIVQKCAKGGEVTGPPTYEDWLKSLIKNDLWMHPDYYMAHSLNTATKVLKLASAKLPGREATPPIPAPVEVKGEFPQEWAMNNLYSVENPKKKGVTKKYAKMYDSRTLGAGVDVVSGHPELYNKAKRFGIEKELADKIAYEHIVHDDLVIRDNYADIYGKAAADTLSFGPRFLVAQARYQLGNVRKGWDEIHNALAKGDAEALKKAVLKVTPEDHDYRKKWVKNFNVYGNEPE